MHVFLICACFASFVLHWYTLKNVTIEFFLTLTKSKVKVGPVKPFCCVSCGRWRARVSRVEVCAWCLGVSLITHRRWTGSRDHAVPLVSFHSMAEGVVVRMDRYSPFNSCLQSWREDFRLSKRISSHLIQLQRVFITMADRGVDFAALPKEVRDHLAELELELSEGKKRDGVITQFWAVYFNPTTLWHFNTHVRGLIVGCLLLLNV